VPRSCGVHHFFFLRTVSQRSAKGRFAGALAFSPVWLPSSELAPNTMNEIQSVRSTVSDRTRYLLELRPAPGFWGYFTGENLNGSVTS
jgi:hypothetical protein